MTRSGRDFERISMLFVEDNPIDAHLVKALLAVADVPVHIEVVGDLRQAVERLTQRSFDVILLDLSLPDAHGLEALHRVLTHAPEIAIVVLTGRDDRNMALQAVRNGAQDYLTKERMNTEVLLRAVRYAMERHRLLAAIRDLSLKDPLTGLFNRRGFFMLADRQLKLATRTRCRLALFYLDVDGLKKINDRLGHCAGDRAIKEAADIIRQTFRTSDISARIGGDEFAVLALDLEADGTAVIPQRIQEALAIRNALPHCVFGLSLSIGTVIYDLAARATVDKLLACADASMYANKRTHSGDDDCAAPSAVRLVLQ